MTEPAPTLTDIQATRTAIRSHIVLTPTAPLLSADVPRLLGPAASVVMKLELFQATGTFKARGAITNALRLQAQSAVKGLTAASAGNHAVATAWAARRIGVAAKVVMVKTANPLRVALATAEGATVIMADTAVDAFATVDRIVRDDGFAPVHPFDGHATACGTGTLGLEILEQSPDLDAVIVSIGGGGLAGGLARAIKLTNPTCRILGVEPVGADAMSRSIAAGHPVKLDKVDTLVDSLAPPMALPYGYALCRDHLDDLVTLSDDAILAGLALLQRDAKLAVEPAAGAVVAALFGPYRRQLAGKRIGLIICGANIDGATYAGLLGRGTAGLDSLVT